MGRTRMGRTDGLTDGQSGDYMLPRNFSGSIINDVIICEENLNTQKYAINQH